MKPTLPRTLVFALFVGTGLLVHAQDKTPVTPVEYLRPMKNSFSIGVRMIGGAKVTFGGNLGATPFAVSRDRVNAGGYNNGTISADDKDAANGDRPAYSDNTCVKWNSIPGGVEGRYYTIILDSDGEAVRDANGDVVITGNYVYYNKDDTNWNHYTRNWSYSGDSGQLRDNPDNSNYQQIGMSAFSSRGSTDTVTAEDRRNPGVELSMGRVIQRFKHFEWGIGVSFAVSEFNAKTRQSVNVKLDYITDWYDIYTTGDKFDGTPTKGKLKTHNDASSFPNIFVPTESDDEYQDLKYTYTDSNGSEVSGYTALETTNPIGNTIAATEQSDLSDPDGDKLMDGTADGYWQVKGVYYMLRLGPMVRIPIGKRFSAYLSGGYMAAYVGSKFRYEENVNVPYGSSSISTAYTETYANGYSHTIDTKNNQKYLGGFYFDANLEWWTSTRTGFYAGVAYERLNSYKQDLHGRNANIKMDNGLGFRFGIITRF
ncbi:hypothetical protein M2103_002612 [Ereboglobus sp. PH5-5]|uniref:hypothetical protein n=1 Tax=Ereboglobus sp. PH5-5 TaxID=2940529 RepID=UPI002406B2CC|nr:hypothetical protein [Ereboglobus sp. PH5-5]MDF9834364.1 hypothetical protein [Ereboglobus sp. PH5-5]